jgi:hypothetical protein
VTWLALSAVLMAITAAIHSYGGEKRLITPLLTSRNGILKHAMSRAILRGAWHLTSLFMLLTAAVMLWPETNMTLKALVAGVWLAIGLFSLITSRGKHIGWPTLTAAGVTGLIGSLA